MTAASPTPERARAAAEHAARASYGRLVALLAASTGDVELAEDALGDAFEQAVRRWPADGVPDNPEGWLLTVARNRLRDVLASAERRHRARLDVGPTGDLDPGRRPRRRGRRRATCGRAGPSARAAARLRPPRHRPGDPHPSHAPDGAGLRRRRGGPGLPRPTGRDGPAPGPGQAADQDGRHPLPGATARAARRAAARGDGGGVRRRGHRARRGPDRGGAVAGRAAGLAARVRARGVGARGAADAVVGPRGRARPRALRAAGGAGPRARGTSSSSPRARRCCGVPPDWLDRPGGSSWRRPSRRSTATGPAPASPTGAR